MNTIIEWFGPVNSNVWQQTYNTKRTDDNPVFCQSLFESLYVQRELLPFPLGMAITVGIISSIGLSILIALSATGNIYVASGFLSYKFLACVLPVTTTALLIFPLALILRIIDVQDAKATHYRKLDWTHRAGWETIIVRKE